MSNEELKPCPFCGGAPELRLYDSEYFVQCIQCFGSTSADHQTEAEATAAWNRRDALAQPAAIQGGMGEAVDVVGYKFTANRDANETFLSKDGGFFAHHTNEPLMTVAQHQRIVAARAAELADAKSARDAYAQNAIDLQKQRDALRAELERVRQGSLFLLDAHAELEAARKQEPTHEQMMAGYEIACRYGVYEASAFNLAEAMYKAMVSARPEEIQTSVGEADPSKILVTALRQYMHNDGSGLVAGYDYEETQRIVAAIVSDMEAGNPNINGMVDRFLSWPLPSDVCADPCAAIPGTPHRYGTNLLTADQARAMLEHVLALPPLAGQVSVPRELLRRVCWPVVSGSDRHTHSEAVAELRALLATPSMEVKHDA